MEFGSQNVARLVLGYLKEEQMKGAYDEFLQHSPHLSELRSNKMKFYTRITGLSLTDFLTEYENVFTIIQSHLEATDYFKEFNSRFSLIEKLQYLLSGKNSLTSESANNNDKIADLSTVTNVDELSASSTTRVENYIPISGVQTVSDDVNSQDLRNRNYDPEQLLPQCLNKKRGISENKWGVVRSKCDLLPVETPMEISYTPSSPISHPFGFIKQIGDVDFSSLYPGLKLPLTPQMENSYTQLSTQPTDYFNCSNFHHKSTDAEYSKVTKVDITESEGLNRMACSLNEKIKNIYSSYSKGESLKDQEKFSEPRSAHLLRLIKRIRNRATVLHDLELMKYNLPGCRSSSGSGIDSSVNESTEDDSSDDECAEGIVPKNLLSRKVSLLPLSLAKNILKELKNVEMAIDSLTRDKNLEITKQHDLEDSSSTDSADDSSDDECSEIIIPKSTAYEKILSTSLNPADELMTKNGVTDAIMIDETPEPLSFLPLSTHSLTIKENLEILKRHNLNVSSSSDSRDDSSDDEKQQLSSFLNPAKEHVALNSVTNAIMICEKPEPKSCSFLSPAEDMLKESTGIKMPRVKITLKEYFARKKQQHNLKDCSSNSFENQLSIPKESLPTPRPTKSIKSGEELTAAIDVTDAVTIGEKSKKIVNQLNSVNISTQYVENVENIEFTYNDLSNKVIFMTHNEQYKDKTISSKIDKDVEVKLSVTPMQIILDLPATTDDKRKSLVKHSNNHLSGIVNHVTSYTSDSFVDNFENNNGVKFSDIKSNLPESGGDWSNVNVNSDTVQVEAETSLYAVDNSINRPMVGNKIILEDDKLSATNNKKRKRNDVFEEKSFVKKNKTK